MNNSNDQIIKTAEIADSEVSAKPHLSGMLLPELQELLAAAGIEKYRAKQIWQWFYKKGATSFEQMQNLPAKVRDALNQHFEIARPAIHLQQKSSDGTRKWLLEFEDKNKAETVFIPDEERGTLCVSSQVGCTLTCKFCHTGTQKLVRNLSANEIVDQFLLARDELSDWNRNDGDMQLTNIVMMGMGEPLFNFDNVARALRIIMDPDGIGFSKRRITLSTSGVVPIIEKCGQELGVNLAVSLHAVSDTLRNEIVPLNKKYPIKDLLNACRNYPNTNDWRRITFEYVMLKDINDSDEDARELVKLVKDIPAKINLIPFNPWPGAPYECSSGNRIHAFSNILRKGGLDAPIRTPRGRDILAACGQLKSDSERVRKNSHADVSVG